MTTPTPTPGPAPTPAPGAAAPAPSRARVWAARVERFALAWLPARPHTRWLRWALTGLLLAALCLLWFVAPGPVWLKVALTAVAFCRPLWHALRWLWGQQWVRIAVVVIVAVTALAAFWLLVPWPVWSKLLWMAISAAVATIIVWGRDFMRDRRAIAVGLVVLLAAGALISGIAPWKSNASKPASASRTTAVATADDVTVSIAVTKINDVTPEGDVSIDRGDELELTLNVKNDSKQSLTVSGVESALGVEYIGAKSVAPGKSIDLTGKFAVTKSVAKDKTQLDEIATVKFDGGLKVDGTAAWNMADESAAPAVGPTDATDDDVIAALTESGLTPDTYRTGWDAFIPVGAVFGPNSFCPGLQSKADLQACLDSGTDAAEAAIGWGMERTGQPRDYVTNADNWQIRQFNVEIESDGNTGFVGGSVSAPYGVSTGRIGEAILTITGPDGIAWYRFDCGNPQMTVPKPARPAPTPPSVTPSPVGPPTPPPPAPHCEVPGKEHLPPDDPGCKEEPPPPSPHCEVPGKEHLPPDDPECLEAKVAKPAGPMTGGDGQTIDVTCENVEQLFAEGKITAAEYAEMRGICFQEEDPGLDPEVTKCDDGQVFDADTQQCVTPTPPDVQCTDGSTVSAGQQCPDVVGEGGEDNDGVVSDDEIPTSATLTATTVSQEEVSAESAAVEPEPTEAVVEPVATQAEPVVEAVQVVATTPEPAPAAAPAPDPVPAAAPAPAPAPQPAPAPAPAPQPDPPAPAPAPAAPALAPAAPAPVVVDAAPVAVDTPADG